jgi:hypothetical protein
MNTKPHTGGTGPQTEVGVARWITFYNDQRLHIVMSDNRTAWSTSTPAKLIGR